MKILITGGAGFVGSNLAIKLKEKYPSYEIVVFDNLRRRGSELNLNRLKQNGIKFIHGDIRNKEDFEQVGFFDLMIECSAEPSVMAGINSSPSYVLDTNLKGTLNCLEEVRKKNAKIIFLSTSRVYPIEKINKLNFEESENRIILGKNNFVEGLSEKGIAENFPLDGARSLYGATKLCSEIIIQEYFDNYGTGSIINRCGVITGPWQMGKIDQGVIMLWVAKHIFNEKLSYIGYGGLGKQVRDFIHIDDLFDIIDFQISHFEKFNGEIFNIGGGVENSVSLKELTSICQEITKNQVEIDSVKETRKADLKWFITDCTKIKQRMNWSPKKNIWDTVRDISNWMYENQRQLKDILD